jgi:hypothetical protein
MFPLFSHCKKTEELPDCNDLYVKYVHRWDENPEHKILIVKPDMLQSYDPDTDFASLVDSNDEGYIQIKQQVETMVLASRQDLQELVKFEEFSLETIDKLDKAINRQYINSVIDASSEDDNANQYLISTIEFGCALAETMENEIGGFVWVYDYPYWESTIVHKQTGFEIPIFHWAIKKYSEYGVDDGFKDKILSLKRNLEELK